MLTMRTSALLPLLLSLLAGISAAPLQEGGPEPAACDDAQALMAAKLALTEINQDRQDGYVFSLHRLSNVHMAQHGENAQVFYLTLDVVETNCSVLSGKRWQDCEARPIYNTPVYGQCKAAIFISRVNRVVRLYKYNCAIRPAPAARVSEIVADMPTLISIDNAEIQKTVSQSLNKFNAESGLKNRFTLLKINRATSGMGGMGSMFYNAEYTIQETTCANTAAAADACPLMDCEFAHKGFCKASHYHTPSGDEVSVDCEIYESESAEREKRAHLLGGETDHSHTPSSGADSHSHDHTHDHTRDHHDHTAPHDGQHHHTHDHPHSHGGQRHSHAHSHDHSHDHDHVHAHHAQAHLHDADVPNQHHNYHHGPGVNTHEHDHEMALDHDHKHQHLHDHEHHHHHHDHQHETTSHSHPEGMVRVLPPMDQPTTLPAFPDMPVGDDATTLQARPDPQIPGAMEPRIGAFPTAVSASCPAPPLAATLVENLFAEDPLFRPTA